MNSANLPRTGARIPEAFMRPKAAAGGGRLRLAKAALVLVVGALAAVSLATLIGEAHFDEGDFLRPQQSLRVTDRNGNPLRITRPDGDARRWLPLEEIPDHVIDAFLAAEDARFFEHNGVDWAATTRAVVNTVVPGRPRSGASTISQQTIKLVYGRPHGRWSKPLEILRARALEAHFSKERILEEYLNRIPFGDRIVGLPWASEAYFGKPPAELTIGEAALLAGVPQAPSVTEPRRHLARARRRQATILRRLRDLRRIDDTEHRAALERTPRIRTKRRPWHAPRFVDRTLGRYRSGTAMPENRTLRTSLHLPLQHRTEERLRRSVHRLLPRGVTNGAAMLVDHHSGEVLAYVGAARREEGAPGAALDLLQSRRQPGSTLKPFAFNLFFRQGGTAASMLEDIPRAMRDGSGAIFDTANYDGQPRGPVRAREALASSLNLAALDVVRRTRPRPFAEELQRLGFRDRRLRAPTIGAGLVLGGIEVSPEELLRAYAALARGGASMPLRTFPSASISEAPPRAPETEVTASILRDGDARAQAFGRSLEDLAGGPFALKTGTSTGWRDAWSVAFDDRHTVVVWLGDPQGRPLAEVSGFEAAAPLAAALLGDAKGMFGDPYDAQPAAPRPALVTLAVCPLSGARATPRCPGRIQERFLPTALPEHRCPFHSEGGLHLPPRFRRWAEDTGLHPSGESTDSLRITFPRPGASLLLPPESPLRPRSSGGNGAVRYLVDGRPIGPNWVAPEGHLRLVAQDAAGNESAVEAEVRYVR